MSASHQSHPPDAKFAIYEVATTMQIPGRHSFKPICLITKPGPRKIRREFATTGSTLIYIAANSGISLRHGQRDSAVPVILRTFSWKFWRAPSPANKVGDSLYRENRRVQQTELSFVKLFISEAESAGTTEYLHIKHFQQWKSNAE